MQPVVPEYRPPSEFHGLIATTHIGPPQIYTMIGTDIYFAPPPDSVDTGSGYQYSMWYFQKVPPLTDTNLTNWLLTAAPDLYLYAALLESAPFLVDDKRIETWSGLYGRSMTSLLAQDARSRYRPHGRIRASATGMLETSRTSR